MKKIILLSSIILSLASSANTIRGFSNLEQASKLRRQCPTGWHFNPLLRHVIVDGDYIGGLTSAHPNSTHYLNFEATSMTGSISYVTLKIEMGLGVVRKCTSIQGFVNHGTIQGQ